MPSNEIGSGNGTIYPGAIDVNAIPEVNSPNAGKTKARKEPIEDLTAAVIAIETELGTDPAGALVDVKTFLQAQHQTNGTHKSTHGPHAWIDAADYATLTDAANAAIGKTLVISSSINLTLAEAAGGAVVIPATVLGVFPMAPGIINKNTAASFTCNAPVIGNAKYQWLSGFAAGDLLFGENIEEMPIEWTGGGIGKTAAQNYTAAAVLLASKTDWPIVKFGLGEYLIEHATLPAIKVAKRAGIRGVVMTPYAASLGTIIRNTGTTDCCEFDTPGFASFIEDMTLQGNVNSGMGLVLDNADNTRVTNVMIGDYSDATRGHGSHGLRIKKYSYWSRFENLWICKNGGDGINIGSYVTGTGTGTLNTLTDNTKAWATNEHQGNHFRDSAGNRFAVTANTATTLTVAGTPATGSYVLADYNHPTNDLRFRDIAVLNNAGKGIYATAVQTLSFVGSADVEGNAGLGVHLDTDCYVVSTDNFWIEGNNHGGVTPHDLTKEQIRVDGGQIAAHHRIRGALVGLGGINVISGNHIEIVNPMINGGWITLGANTTHCVVDLADGNATITDNGAWNQFRSTKIANADYGANIALLATSGTEYVEAKDSITVTLPDCSGSRFLIRTVSKKDAAGTITIARAGSNTINGATSITMTGQYSSRTLVGSDGRWVVASSVGS